MIQPPRFLKKYASRCMNMQHEMAAPPLDLIPASMAPLAT
jgi:hypothetical protein